jgi:hypothetical protein
MKNSNDTIGNQTRKFPACGEVRQPTAPPRVPVQLWRKLKWLHLAPPKDGVFE